LYSAKELEKHYLLSGDADGAIILWEFSLLERKVIACVPDQLVNSFHF